MKKVLIVSFFCFLSQIDFAGCTCPRLYINGITSPYDGGGIFYVNPNDSFLLKLDQGTCIYSIESSSILFNNKKVGLYNNFSNIKLPCTPGVYRILAKTTICSTLWDITFIAKPKVVDTTAVVAETLTALPPIKILNPDFLFYPNPVHEELTILNESDEIRFVAFYNLSGQLLSKYEVNGAKAKIPLNSYPPGMYFIHVATLSNKIIIKKISVI